MITKKQHLKICEKLSALKILGFPIETHSGIRIMSVDAKTGRINLANKTFLTHKSYFPTTKLIHAWKKFIIREIDLYKLCKLKREKEIIL